MRYISTRGQAPARDFADVLLAASPRTAACSCRKPGRISARRLAGDARPAVCRAGRAGHAAVRRRHRSRSRCCGRSASDAYAGFGHPAVVPLVQLETDLFTQELFHGPTLAFKDMAMQVLGRLFDHVLTRARPAGDDRRRDLGRYRIGGDRGLRRPRPRRYHHPASARAHQRGAAPADDHGAGPERRQRRDRGHVRRLPGPGEGDVRRHRISATRCACRR